MKIQDEIVSYKDLFGLTYRDIDIETSIIYISPDGWYSFMTDTLTKAFCLYCSINNVSMAEIRSKSRKAKLSLQRQVFMYIAIERLNIKPKYQVGVLNRNRTTIYYSHKRISEILSLKHGAKDIEEMIDKFMKEYEDNI